MKNKSFVVYNYVTFDRWQNTKYKSKELLIHHGKNSDYVKLDGLYCGVGYWGDFPYLRGDWSAINFHK